MKGLKERLLEKGVSLQDVSITCAVLDEMAAERYRRRSDALDVVIAATVIVLFLF